MSGPRPLRNWSGTTYNIVPTQGSVAIQGSSLGLAFKNTHLSAGYVTLGSSNGGAVGGTASINDGVDRWGTTADLFWNNAGSLHGWWHGASRIGMLPFSNRIYACIKLSTGPTNQTVISYAYATSPFTAGSTTADPTSPTNTYSFGSKNLASATYGDVKYHVVYNTFGDFIFLVSADVGTIVQHATIMVNTAGYDTLDDGYPFVGCCNYSTSGRGGLSEVTLGTAGSAGIFSKDGTIVTGSRTGILQNGITNMCSVFTSSGQAGTGKYPDPPIGAITYQPTKERSLGSLVDICMAPIGTGVTQSTVAPLVGTPVWTIVGGLWLPANGYTPSFGTAVSVPKDRMNLGYGPIQVPGMANILT